MESTQEELLTSEPPLVCYRCDGHILYGERRVRGITEDQNYYLCSECLENWLEFAGVFPDTPLRCTLCGDVYSAEAANHYYSGPWDEPIDPDEFVCRQCNADADHTKGD